MSFNFGQTLMLYTVQCAMDGMIKNQLIFDNEEALLKLIEMMFDATLL